MLQASLTLMMGIRISLDMFTGRRPAKEFWIRRQLRNSKVMALGGAYDGLQIAEPPHSVVEAGRAAQSHPIRSETSFQLGIGGIPK